MMIRVAGNTTVPCLQAILKKGFKVRHYFVSSRPDDWSSPQWDATKDELTFSATSTEELLGLIAMQEQRGVDWKANSEEDGVYERFVEEAQLIVEGDQ